MAKLKWLSFLKTVFFFFFFFSRKLFHAHVLYVCNESAKNQIASLNTLRRVDFTVHAIYSQKPKQRFKKNKGK